MWFLIAIVVLLIIMVYIFFQQSKFGKASTGKRWERMKNSPNFKNGQFQNLNPTPALTEGVSYTSVLKEFFFEKKPHRKPPVELPAHKTDLFKLDPKEDIITWFGHSSYFLQLDGKKFLVDPVLSGSASPVKFTTRAFPGSDVYTVEEIPPIDYLIITHDHWDHLDHDTIVQLKSKVGRVITGLGVGAHLEHWGYHPGMITELDWNEEVQLEQGFTIHSAPARHFSGRTFKRNTTLWSSYILTTPANRIYIGGDSGYDDHFKTIGDQFGPFDLVILENGQYDKNWKYIHMLPEEVVKAAEDLKAKRLLPVHWSKFALGNHPWNEPIIRVTREATARNMEVLHPLIGEPVYFKQPFKGQRWWESMA
jgi:L-ascorbate metabolism protein UlaG (beta-lactamase superfamily)